jgi:hypothetical protein
MRQGRSIALRLVGGLIGVAAALTVGVTVFVYSGQEHCEAVTSAAREFFVFVERGSRVRRAPVSALASPTPEGGIIQ